MVAFALLTLFTLFGGVALDRHFHRARLDAHHRDLLRRRYGGVTDGEEEACDNPTHAHFH